jgi:hypothetical protein
MHDGTPVNGVDQFVPGFGRRQPEAFQNLFVVKIGDDPGRKTGPVIIGILYFHPVPFGGYLVPILRSVGDDQPLLL